MCIMKQNWYLYSTSEIVRQMGSRFRSYRIRKQLTQQEIADLTGINKNTIIKFETGQANNIGFATLLLLLKSLGLLDCLDQIMPPLPESPYVRPNTKRIRHSNL